MEKLVNSATFCSYVIDKTMFCASVNYFLFCSMAGAVFYKLYDKLIS